MKRSVSSWDTIFQDETKTPMNRRRPQYGASIDRPLSEDPGERKLFFIDYTRDRTR